jgi:hypothetical protein
MPRKVYNCPVSQGSDYFGNIAEQVGGRYAGTTDAAVPN